MLAGNEPGIALPKLHEASEWRGDDARAVRREGGCRRCNAEHIAACQRYMLHPFHQRVPPWLEPRIVDEKFELLERAAVIGAPEPAGNPALAAAELGSQYLCAVGRE